jgi:hypothetical protein
MFRLGVVLCVTVIQYTVAHLIAVPEIAHVRL